MAMKLNTGKVAFKIEFDNGDKQEIFFNPNDPNLSIRMKDFKDKIAERIKELEDIKVDAAGNADNTNSFEDIENFRKLQNIIFEELDYAFGGEISNVVFKYCSPFAVVDGNYFIMQFIDAITPEIEANIKKAKAEADAKMQKHIAKYQQK